MIRALGVALTAALVAPPLAVVAAAPAHAEPETSQTINYVGGSRIIWDENVRRTRFEAIAVCDVNPYLIFGAQFRWKSSTGVWVNSRVQFDGEPGPACGRFQFDIPENRPVQIRHVNYSHEGDADYYPWSELAPRYFES